MKTFALRIALYLALLATTIPAYAASLCYGIPGAGCRPTDAAVSASNPLPLPGDLQLRAPGESRLTLVVTLPTGYVWTAATINGSANAPTGTATLTASTDADTITLTNMVISGPVTSGDQLFAHVRAFNPNGATKLLFDERVLIADVDGVTTVNVLTLNPGGNANQQTFLRLVNLRNTSAIVRLVPTDDAGVVGGQVDLLLMGNEALQVTSEDLEAGNVGKGLQGAFGRGTGKWRVRIVAGGVIGVHVLVRGADGSLSALERLP